MVEERLQTLNAILDTFPRLLIAYSGGVDSACLMKAAQLRLGERVHGVIADSPSLPRSELDQALALAQKMGVAVEILQTEEFQNPDYLSNPVNRCYFCKTALFEKMNHWASKHGYEILAYGENADDSRDVRPGGKAAAEFQIRAPLKEAGLTKQDVRELSASWGLSTWDKPASPCLSSRIPHGTPVTLEALSRIESGEAAIRKLGFREFRLRYHGAKARLEFAPDELMRVEEQGIRQAVIQAAEKAGFREVEIDPRGYHTPLKTP